VRKHSLSKRPPPDSASASTLFYAGSTPVNFVLSMCPPDRDKVGQVGALRMMPSSNLRSADPQRRPLRRRNGGSGRKTMRTSSVTSAEPRQARPKSQTLFPIWSGLAAGDTMTTTTFSHSMVVNVPTSSEVVRLPMRRPVRSGSKVPSDQDHCSQSCGNSLTVTDLGGGRFEAFGDEHLTTLGDCRSAGISMVVTTRRSLCETVLAKNW
jgi:hypothetical protein